MSSAITSLKPALLWKHFDALTKIPRCSKNESAAGEYVLAEAKRLHLVTNKDDAGNIVVRVPATPGHENAPIVVLQGHLDMVCEKNSNTPFDFDKDPIQTKIAGDWVTACGTTLGADNGIGVAAGLAIAEDEACIHGPLELLMTTDEETGLNGAISLKSDFIQGRIMINLDSEEEGAFSIGCAGGGDVEMTLPIKRQNGTQGQILNITFSGLRGGHSGIDIHTGRGNATQLLARMLSNVKIPFELISLEGGNKHNAIPREAFAAVIVEPGNVEDFKKAMQKQADDIAFEYKAVEKEMALSIVPGDSRMPPMDRASSDKFLAFLYALPHGVLAMSQEIPGLVETSNNLAIVRTLADTATVYTSTRSSIMSALDAVCNRIKAVAKLAGAEAQDKGGYPSWTPNLDSPVLKIMKTVYQKLSGKEAKVYAIHAGLECGIIGEKYPGMDMISFGPDLKNPHSPDEKVHIESVQRFYNLLVNTLETLS